MEIKLLTPNAKVPTYAHKGDAAFDIYTTESLQLFPGQRHTFKTGIASRFSPKYFVNLLGRSGLAHHHGVVVLGGVIDSSYRGEWGIIVLNSSPNVLTVTEGDRIVQGVFLPVPKFKIKLVKELKASARGTKAYGSTGR